MIIQSYLKPEYKILIHSFLVSLSSIYVSKMLISLDLREIAHKDAAFKGRLILASWNCVHIDKSSLHYIFYHTILLYSHA